MNVKAIALAAAAAAAATSANAADLPSANAVDYVKACDAYGSGFFVMPGSDTCLKVGGRVRIEARFNNFSDDGVWGDKTKNSTNFYARGYARLDARTQSELGLIRSYASLYITDTSDGSSSATLESGFVQVGGFFVGRDYSQFDQFTGYVNGDAVRRGYSDQTTWSATYTADLGQGFTAKIGTEDATDRVVGVVDASGTLTEAGTRLPTIMGGLNFNQGWGSAALYAAAQELRSIDAGVDSTVGYGVQATVKLNLDMLTPGSQAVFQAAYADGAMSYIGADQKYDADGAVSGTKIEKSKGYTFGGGLNINLTDTVSARGEGTYMSVKNDVTGDYKRYATAGSLEYATSEGLRLAGVVSYANTDFSTDSANVDTKDTRFTFRVQRDF
ncbi:porin [Polycladidibacter stylochi]|uniref:porin n=1 Tax=Polycladidibacter stylochi TaxID=1807766 RepID=UPI00082D74CE|nr:porin [Pseudovibrio stylochi]